MNTDLSNDLSNSNISYRGSENTPYRFIKCSIEDCHYYEDSNTDISEHVKSHYSVITCSVDKCGKSFLTLDNLAKHKKSHFPINKTYKCNYPNCHKSFTASYNLKIHYRIHVGDRPFKCKKCGCSYYDKANYKYHVRTAHKNTEAKDTICSHSTCKTHFKSKRQKNQHHDKLETECVTEKNLLIKLAGKFQEALRGIIDTFDMHYIKNRKDFVELKDEINSIKLSNSEYFDIVIDKNI